MTLKLSVDEDFRDPTVSVCVNICVGCDVPAHGTAVSAVNQEYGPESSGHSHVRRLSDQNHYGLHKLQLQHARLHKDKRRHLPRPTAAAELWPSGNSPLCISYLHHGPLVPDEGVEA